MRQIFVILLIALASNVVKAADNVWLLVDTKAQSLFVNQGDKTLEVLENIAIGKSVLVLSSISVIM